MNPNIASLYHDEVLLSKTIFYYTIVNLTLHRYEKVLYIYKMCL